MLLYKIMKAMSTKNELFFNVYQNCSVLCLFPLIFILSSNKHCSNRQENDLMNRGKGVDELMVVKFMKVNLVQN